MDAEKASSVLVNRKKKSDMADELTKFKTIKKGKSPKIEKRLTDTESVQKKTGNSEGGSVGPGVDDVSSSESSDEEKSDKERSAPTATPKPRKRRQSVNEKLLEDVMNDLDFIRDDAASPRYGSNRAAAVIAKSRINSRVQKSADNSGVSNSADEKLVSENTKQIKEKSKNSGAQWVACDSCGKWRSLPSSIDTEALPSVWYCSMNEWDPLHNTCDAPDQSQLHGTEGMKKRDDGMIGSESTSFKGRSKARRKSGAHKGGRGDMDMEEDRANAADDDDSDQDVGHTGGHNPTKRRSVGKARSQQAAIIDKVDWVQCNKCSKWRKVPGNINVEDLPEVWFCYLNTWAPNMARCSAKQEVDPSVEGELNAALNSTLSSSSSSPRNRNSSQLNGGGRLDTSFTSPSSNQNAVGFGSGAVSGDVHKGKSAPIGSDGDVTLKKVTQWVQCERRNCKKWRKLPGHVDSSQLPEKWFCEMNIWDIDRAFCEGPEETDSENEQQASTTGNRGSQLLSANSKGPGALSYRRIIFGTDGRVRPSYSDKNKNGYGLFSYTEGQRPNDVEENAEPTRRIGYWWSSTYDEAGALFVSTNKRHPSSNSLSFLKREAKENAGFDGNQEKETSSSSNSVTTFPLSTSSGLGSSSAISSTISASPRRSAGKESTSNTSDAGSALLARLLDVPANTSTHLLDCAVRLAGAENKLRLSYPPKHRIKQLNTSHLLTAIQRGRIESSIVRSCLLASSTASLSISSLFSMISSSFFHRPEEEICRKSMGLEKLKHTVRNLELAGEVEVTLSNSGEIFVQALSNLPVKNNAFASTTWSHQGLPLRLRKATGKLLISQENARKREEVSFDDCAKLENAVASRREVPQEGIIAAAVNTLQKVGGREAEIETDTEINAEANANDVRVVMESNSLQTKTDAVEDENKYERAETNGIGKETEENDGYRERYIPDSGNCRRKNLMESDQSLEAPEGLDASTREGLMDESERIRERSDLECSVTGKNDMTEMVQENMVPGLPTLNGGDVSMEKKSN